MGQDFSVGKVRHSGCSSRLFESAKGNTLFEITLAGRYGSKSGSKNGSKNGSKSGSKNGSKSSMELSFEP